MSHEYSHLTRFLCGSIFAKTDALLHHMQSMTKNQSVPEILNAGRF
jgi:hypothetical protein